MKNTLLIIAVVLSLCSSLTKGQTIINPGFELVNSDGTLQNWGNVYIFSAWFDSSGVSHTDSIVYDGQFYAPTNDFYSGSKALELRNAWNYTTNTGIAGAVGLDDDTVFTSWGPSSLLPAPGTPFNPFMPSNFGFYHKFNQVNGDSAQARITLWDSTGNQIAEGTLIISAPSSVYTLITAPITYTMPGDVAYYTFFISNFYTADPGYRQPSFGTRLQVDNIGFNMFSADVAEGSNNINSINIYPNPAGDQISINRKSNNETNYRIYNLFGVVVQEGVMQTSESTLSLNNFKEGVYYLELSSKQGKEGRRFVVSK